MFITLYCAQYVRLTHIVVTFEKRVLYCKNIPKNPALLPMSIMC